MLQALIFSDDTETVVRHFEDDKKAAAKALGVSLKTLYTKLKKYRGE